MTDIISIYLVWLHSYITCTFSMKYMPCHVKKKELSSMTIYSFKMECVSGMIRSHGMKDLSIWAIGYR